MGEDTTPCMLDENRPCDSRSRSRFRYTRSDIETIARKCKIKNIKKKTITQLCHEIRSFVNLYQDVLHTAQAPQQRECPQDVIQAYRTNYTCDPATGQWVKMNKTHDSFSSAQLNSMDYNTLVTIATYLKIDVEQGETKDSIIHSILRKEYRHIQNSRSLHKLKTIVQRFRRYRIRDKVQKKISVKIYYNNFKVNGVVNLLSNTKRPLRYNAHEAEFSGYSEVMYRRQFVGTDIDGLKKNEDWFDLQRAYQMNLPFLKKLIILTYTHGGDKIIHSLIGIPASTFNIGYTFVGADGTYMRKKYLTSFVYPLYPVFIFLLTSTSPSRRTEFIEFVKSSVRHPNPGKLSVINDILEKSGAYNDAYSPHHHVQRGDDLFRHYKEVVGNIFEKAWMKKDFYILLLKQYKSILEKIISEAPPLLHALVVYKGVQSVDYMQFDVNNMYTNNRFLSTTYDAKTAANESFTTEDCCLQKIILLKATKCLYPIMSYYNEYEILLAPGKKLYATSKLYRPQGGVSQKRTMNLVVTN